MQQDAEILFRKFQCQVGRKDIFKLTTGNESLHEICNDNGHRIVNFATTKNLIAKYAMFPKRNIHKFITHTLRQV
jgi:hypothetical protein